MHAVEVIPYKECKQIVKRKMYLEQIQYTRTKLWLMLNRVTNYQSNYGKNYYSDLQLVNHPEIYKSQIVKVISIIIIDIQINIYVVKYNLNFIINFNLNFIINLEIIDNI